MWGQRPRAIVDAMARTSVTIVLDVDHIEDCPSGTARLLEGPARSFHGWLGLAEAIDALVRTQTSVGHVDREPATEGSQT